MSRDQDCHTKRKMSHEHDITATSVFRKNSKTSVSTEAAVTLSAKRQWTQTGNDRHKRCRISLSFTCFLGQEVAAKLSHKKTSVLAPMYPSRNARRLLLFLLCERDSLVSFSPTPKEWFALDSPTWRKHWQTAPRKRSRSHPSK